MTSARLPAISHPALESFADTAAAFRNLVDRRATFSSGKVFLTEILRFLPDLYTAGLALPPTAVLFTGKDTDEAHEPESEPHHHIDRTNWGKLNRDLGRLFGPFDLYREIFDPYEPRTEEEVVGTLSDDVASLYEDLGKGLNH